MTAPATGRRAEGERPPRGLYVHVPFCEKICHYCDFNKYLLRDGGVDEYLEALEREVALYGAQLFPAAGGPSAPGPDRLGRSAAPEPGPFDTVYVGGGTPTSLSAAQLERLLSAVMGGFPVAAGAEVTVEANPGTLSPRKLAALKRGGVNRISLGVQSANDELLRALGRIHTARQARESFERAREWFDNVSVDLIYALPGQDEDDWRRTLEEVVRWRPDHLSCYGLIIEDGTLFGELMRQGRLDLPGDERELAMYRLAMDFLAGHGYEHYEIANWALPGRQSRHNRIYWENGEWLGLGPGAHSQWQGRRFANVRLPADYARLVAQGKPPVQWSEAVSERTAMEDTVILGLRLREGVDAGEFARRFGVGLADVFGAEIRRVVERGLAVWDGRRLRLTERGLYLSNQAFQEFIRL